MSRILWMSDGPRLNTGFSSQSLGICNALADDGHEVHYLSHTEGGQVVKPGQRLMDDTEFKFYLHGNGMQPYCSDIIEHRLRELKIDVFGVLLDSFMLYSAGYMNKDFSPSRAQIMYFPSDGGMNLPLNCENILRKFSHPVAMSKFAQAQAKEIHGIDTGYIPHFVDHNLFKPVSQEEKEALKRKWGFQGKYIIFSNFRNQGRKFSDRQLKAFAKAKDKMPNAIMLCNCDPYDPAGYFDMFGLINKLGLTNRVFFTGTRYFKGLTYRELAQVYNLADVMFQSTCILPDMDIQLEGEIKKIKDAKVGDKILTSSGKYRRIEAVIPTTKKDTEILEIKADGLLPLKVTPNHRIYSLSCAGPVDKKRARIERQIELNQASNLKKYDYLIYPIPKITEVIKEIKTKKYKKVNPYNKLANKNWHQLPDKIELDYNFGLFAGFYLSEGCGNKDGLVFCFHKKESEYYNKIQQILDARFDVKTRLRHDTRNRTTLWINSRQLGRLMSDLFGVGSHSKKLPAWILKSPKEFRTGLIEGLWKGDGYNGSRKDMGGNTSELQTVSKQLAHQIFNLLIAEGFNPTISRQQRLSEVFRIRIHGNQGFERITKMILKYLTKKDLSRIFRDENYVYFPISKITKQNYSGKVYDLTVEKEHNFVCHCLVKNSGEGFGICTIEAMSAEVPVLLTSYTTTHELIEHNKAGEGIKLSGTEQLDPFQTGFKNYDTKVQDGTLLGSWMVERGLMSVENAAEKLIKLYNDESLRKEYGRNGRRAVLREYSYEIVSNQWKQLIKRL